MHSSTVVMQPLITLLPGEVNAQNNVAGRTRTAVVTASNGEKYSEMRVVCAGSKGTRYIFRKEGGNRWCVTPNGGECKGKKFAVAKRACVIDADSAVTESLANSSTPVAANVEAVERETSPAAPTATQVVASNNQA